MSARQRTLSGAIEIEGVGLFTAAPARVRLLPAEADSGIVFVRADLADPVRIPASIDLLAPAEHRTALTAGGARVETVEHVLAACMGMGIDNAVVEVFGPELPIGDGSARFFTQRIEAVGVVELAAARRVLRVESAVTVVCDRTKARIEAFPPAPDQPPGMRATYALDYGAGAPIEPHEAAFDTASSDFAQAIAPARTFSTLAEAEQARKMGLFLHLSPKEMLVIGPDGPIENELRFDDEPARHKLLDLVGDLALAGRPIHGRVRATHSGHALNHELARTLLRTEAEAGAGR